MIIEVENENKMKSVGERIGLLLNDSQIIELVGDVGAGKTTLTKGIAKGLSVVDDVQSPSFTINRVYDARDGLRLAHYDFYRLDDAGIMSQELSEAIHDPKTIVVVEWGDIVSGVLPSDRLTITITATGEQSRRLDIIASGEKTKKVEAKL